MKIYFNEEITGFEIDSYVHNHYLHLALGEGEPVGVNVNLAPSEDTFAILLQYQDIPITKITIKNSSDEVIYSHDNLNLVADGATDMISNDIVTKTLALKEPKS